MQTTKNNFVATYLVERLKERLERNPSASISFASSISSKIGGSRIVRHSLGTAYNSIEDSTRDN